MQASASTVPWVLTFFMNDSLSSSFSIIGFSDSVSVSQKWNLLQAQPATTDFAPPTCWDSVLREITHPQKAGEEEGITHNGRPGLIPALSTVWVTSPSPSLSFSLCWLCGLNTNRLLNLFKLTLPQNWAFKIPNTQGCFEY